MRSLEISRAIDVLKSLRAILEAKNFCRFGRKADASQGASSVCVVVVNHKNIDGGFHTFTSQVNDALYKATITKWFLCFSVLEIIANVVVKRRQV